MRATLSRLTLLVVGVLLTSTCIADIITLKNGDHITGKIKGVESGKLVIGTDYAGDIKIDWSKVAAFASDDAVTVQYDEFQRLYGKISGDSTEMKVEGTGGARTQILESKRPPHAYPHNHLP